jgi:hypothetical protein
MLSNKDIQYNQNKTICTEATHWCDAMFSFAPDCDQAVKHTKFLSSPFKILTTARCIACISNTNTCSPQIHIGSFTLLPSLLLSLNLQASFSASNLPQPPEQQASHFPQSAGRTQSFCRRLHHPQPPRMLHISPALSASAMNYRRQIAGDQLLAKACGCRDHWRHDEVRCQGIC